MHLSELPVRLICTGRIEPGLTQGLYHSLAKEMTESSEDTVIICSPSLPYLCIGYHQVLDSVLDVDVCSAFNLPIIRRCIGGGTTLLDCNQIFYQCIFHNSRVPWRADKVYQMMLNAPVNVLNRIGLSGRLRAVNEVEANSVRIAGIGGGRVGEAMVVVGNLLLDFDYSIMSRVWNVPNQSFRDLALETMEERVGTINKLGCNHTPESLEPYLIEAFAESLERPVQESELEREEIQVGINMANDLSSNEFLSLHHPTGEVSPMASLKISADVFIYHIHLQIGDRGEDVSVRVDNGIITDLKTDSPRKNNLRKLLIGYPFSDWV